MPRELVTRGARRRAVGVVDAEPRHRNQYGHIRRRHAHADADTYAYDGWRRRDARALAIRANAHHRSTAISANRYSDTDPCGCADVLPWPAAGNHG